MHDLDGTKFESEFELESYGDPELEFEDEEFEDELEDEFESEFEGDLEDFEAFESENPFSETEEMELAAELLEVADEQELDQFIGKLFKRAVKGARRLSRRIPKSLRRRLRGLARKALPIAGRALGTFVGGPAGGAIGGRLASGAGRLFGLELEGLSPEDQEFEVAKRFVRLAGTAANTAARAGSSANPNQTAKAALVSAARRHAPGMLRRRSGRSRTTAASQAGTRNSGRWQRRGSRIVLFGL